MEARPFRPRFNRRLPVAKVSRRTLVKTATPIFAAGALLLLSCASIGSAMAQTPNPPGAPPAGLPPAGAPPAGMPPAPMPPAAMPPAQMPPAGMPPGLPPRLNGVTLTPIPGAKPVEGIKIPTPVIPPPAAPTDRPVTVK